MLNVYPAWKNALVVIVLLLGVVFALPNLYGEDPAVQVSQRNVAVPGPDVVSKVETALKTAGIAVQRVGIEDERLLARFSDTEAQLKAADVLQRALGSDFTVALNLAPRMPDWMRELGLKPMNLGLDLRGGVHFLLEVDVKAALAQALDRYDSEFRTRLREENIRYAAVERDAEGIVVRFRDAEELTRGRELIAREFPELALMEVEDAEQPSLAARMTEARVREIRDFAVQQNITTLRNRVNELGVAEPIVQRQGQDRIVVQLPGIQDTARAKEILGATATIEFRLVDESGNPYEAQSTGRAPLGSRLYMTRDGRPILLKRDVIVTGDQLTDAASGFDSQTGEPAVFVSLDAKGARKMGETTQRNLGKRMAVVFIENRTEVQNIDGNEVRVKRKVEEVISDAVIRGVFSSRFQITGLGREEARTLALLLRAGALAAPVDIVEERTIGPSLGAANIRQGFLACVVGFLLSVGFATIYYRFFGVVASLALAFNLVLVVGLMSLLQATLTLPGIAGIVLTVGMAIDANVLIYERIREELRSGNTPQAAIHAGYERAFLTIADSNITTLIAGVVLFSLGSGPVKGFAVTLVLGIATSMFTAIMGTRALVNAWYGGRKVEHLSI
ncbi:MAG TPA: protein translocase subunit SecD [Gammaproteobacteria bacterium]|nr:protein translocase subunit SecD [Gammaproteobacteria bacterium]